MTLLDVLQATLYFQPVSVWLRNDYDQNRLLGEGERNDLIHVEENEDIFWHLGDRVRQIQVGPDNTLYVFVADEDERKPFEDQYPPEYVAKWNNLKKETRPWLWGQELPTFMYLSHRRRRNAD